MRHIARAMLPLLLTFSFAACSSEPEQEQQPKPEPSVPSQAHNAPEVAVSEQDVLAILAPVPDGCDPYVILTTPQAIDTYASAGDFVITDPGGNYGLKVTDSDPKCAEHYTAALAVAPW